VSRQASCPPLIIKQNKKVMAIYLNDRVLKADPKGSKIEREYAQGLVEVGKLFDKFRIKGEKESYLQIARKLADKDRIFSTTSHKQKRLPTIALPVEIPYYDDEMGATSLRYSVTPPMANSHGGVSYATKYIEFREFMAITEKQKDLAWFLLFASNLVKRGVYQLVDVQATYEGTYNDIMIKKDVMDALTADEGLARYVAQKFIDESMVRLEGKELIVKVVNGIEANNQWKEVHAELKTKKSEEISGKEKVSAIDYEGEDVQLQECPESIKMFTLKAEAKTLNIPVTFPPQSKNVLYSLIEHVKAKQNDKL
jgi:hypothetical protein